MTLPNHLPELLAASTQRLVDFLRADLEIGFTFAKLAKTEQQLGDNAGFEQGKRNAQRAIDTVRHLETMIPLGKTREEIVDRRTELERILSAL